MKMYFAGNNGGSGEVCREREIDGYLLIQSRLLSYYEIVGNSKQIYSFQLLNRIKQSKEEE